MREFIAITRALSDETRVRALLSLRAGELCLCQIVELIGLATSTVSKHMSILKQARLVESRKEGRWMYFRLADQDSPEEAREAIAWVLRRLARDPAVVRDRKRIATLARKESLCAQRGGKKCAER
jgi:ArsR family transcriptional regulator, arsenate/arsenite/antimonite-responsive transcriptional repressor